MTYILGKQIYTIITKILKYPMLKTNKNLQPTKKKSFKCACYKSWLF